MRKFMKQKVSNKTIADIIHKLDLKKVTIEIIELGQLPFQINYEKLKNTESELFIIKSKTYAPILDKYAYVFKSDKHEDYGKENDEIINYIVSNNSNDYNKENTIFFL